jgi:hypothetical protein
MAGGGRAAPGGAPIHIAAQDGDSVALGQLLAEGVPVDARNKRQHTPLMLAAEHGHASLVRQLLEQGADARLTNTKRLTAREIAGRHLLQNDRRERASDSEIAALLLAAEQRLEAAAATAAAAAAAAGAATGAEPQPRCLICGETIRRRQRVDFLNDDGQSRYVSSFLRSDGLRQMRSHPHHHYHSLLETRQLRKEVSESWAVLAAVHELLSELRLDPSEVVLFDLCSGKGLTAVCLALEFPRTNVVAVDIISDKCLPHTVDLTNLRYAEADLFTCAPLLQAELTAKRQAGGKAGLEQSQAQRQQGLTGILVGSHLCGRLSVQAVELFQTLPEVAALVLSPCCWPRRKDYNRTDDELAQLAGLMWLKATSPDTYTTWGQHLWRLLAAPSRAAAATAATAVGRLALSNRYVQQAIGFDGHSAPRPEPEPEPELLGSDSDKRVAELPAAPAVAIGIKRDLEVLSEKNILITACKKRDPNTVAGHREHALGAQRRYVSSAGVGLWWRHAALREVYGLSLPGAESGERPLPSLQGNTKPFRNLTRSQKVRKRPQSNGAKILAMVEGLGTPLAAANALAERESTLVA